MPLLYLKPSPVAALSSRSANTVYCFQHLRKEKLMTLALFAQWAVEDARKTPEETAQEDRLWEQFEAGINETRDALGMRRL
jgi:hypothetical protein